MPKPLPDITPTATKTQPIVTRSLKKPAVVPTKESKYSKRRNLILNRLFSKKSKDQDLWDVDSGSEESGSSLDEGKQLLSIFPSYLHMKFEFLNL